MKKYSKPAVEIEMFNSTDIITLSGVDTQIDEDMGEGDADALGLS